jgi:predicted nucleic acid-binding protein
MAKHYLDTGALVKLYIVEPGSTFVQERVRRAEELPLNALQETEVRNAILAAGGRRVISRDAMKRTLANFDEDARSGVFAREDPDWAWLWRRADLLARQHTPRILCRTLDILHVAAAELCRADQFLTGDHRQQRLAKAAGLSVIKIPAH